MINIYLLFGVWLGSALVGGLLLAWGVWAIVKKIEKKHKVKKEKEND